MLLSFYICVEIKMSEGGGEEEGGRRNWTGTWLILKKVDKKCNTAIFISLSYSSPQCHSIGGHSHNSYAMSEPKCVAIRIGCHVLLEFSVHQVFCLFIGSKCQVCRCWHLPKKRPTVSGCSGVLVGSASTRTLLPRLNDEISFIQICPWTFTSPLYLPVSNVFLLTKVENFRLSVLASFENHLLNTQVILFRVVASLNIWYNLCIFSNVFLAGTKPDRHCWTALNFQAAA